MSWIEHKVAASLRGRSKADTWQRWRSGEARRLAARLTRTFAQIESRSLAFPQYRNT